MTRDDDLFADALALPAAERAAFLDRACAGDAARRSRLEALLADAADTNGFLETPLAATPVAPALAEEPGDVIGRYKLLEKIGEGGCGVVFMADQREPVRRRVALKVIKLGMDTREVIARFEVERQALALMDHPNIARVLDAGATGNGRPFFVMELVRGPPITRYCDEAKLTPAQRLELFIAVCHAVQHAHQKGVIHRDLKPSNILVTVNDGVATPKVIDFGIAKATQGPLTNKTLFTAFQQFIGTPVYMSPEQADLSSVDIDTRSDIYSLGVLLYELLTGAPPFDPKSLLAGGVDEIRRIIREVEPPRPSTLARKRTVGGALRPDSSADPNVRGIKPLPQPVSAAELEGDLDWIVMRCLEKDRARRYETANALAADLRRHLAHEPVAARPPSVAYLLQKLVRRHRVALGAVAAIAATLVLGIALSTWQAVRATRAERIAVVAQMEEARLRGAESVQRRRAETSELIARRRAYAADMNLAQQSLAIDNLGRATELLNRYRPQPGEPDLRSWEWRYLWQFCRSEANGVLEQGDPYVARLAVTPDGEWLAIAHDFVRTTRTVFLRNLRWGTTRRLFPSEEVTAPAFSPRESLLAVVIAPAGAAGNSSSTPRLLRLWNVAQNRLAREWQIPGQCHRIVFAPDGESLLTIMEGSVIRWRIADGAQLSVCLPKVSPDFLAGRFSEASLSPDCQWLAVPDRARYHLFNLASGEERWAVAAVIEAPGTSAFSPDGMILATASGPAESDIRLWDVATGADLGRLVGHHTNPMQLLFLPDGTLASAGTDQTVRLWDVGTRQLLRTLRGHALEVWSLALLPNQKTLLSGSKDGAILSWDLRAAPATRGPTQLPGWQSFWGFADGGKSVVTMAPEGRIVRWTGRRFENSELLMQVDRPSPPPRTGRAGGIVAQDCPLVAIVGGEGRRQVQIWDWEKRALAGEITLGGSVWEVLGFSDRGAKVLIGMPRELQEFDVKSGMKTRSWRTPRPPVSVSGGYAITADGTQVLMRSTQLAANGVFSLIDVGRGQQRDFPIEPGLPAGFGGFSFDGRLLAMANGIGQAYVWETASFHPVATVSGFTLGTHAAFFSPDGLRLGVTSNGAEAVRLFDTADWQPLLTLQATGAKFSTAEFSPDGNVLGAMSQAGALHLWRAPSWAEIEAAEKEAARK